MSSFRRRKSETIGNEREKKKKKISCRPPSSVTEDEMSTDSYERNASPLLCDLQPISVSLPSDSDSYAEILLGLRRCFPPEPDAAVREINAKILAAAAAREAMVADGKERRSGVSPLSEASAATLQLTDLELPVAERADSGNGEVRVPETGGSRRGRKRRTDQEQEEYWSRRPDWLPEGWTAEVKVRANGATAGTRDRVIRPIGLSIYTCSALLFFFFTFISNICSFKP